MRISKIIKILEVPATLCMLVLAWNIVHSVPNKKVVEVIQDVAPVVVPVQECK